MKKNLLKLSLFICSGLIAQPSPDWTTLQNTNFPSLAAGTRYLDAVDANVVWAIGYNGFQAARNYNWYTLTQDGGNSFFTGNVFADTNTYAVSSIEGIDATTAWVTAYLKTTGNKGVIYKTTNGGGSWVNGGTTTMFNNTSSFANFTCFTNTTTGICLGDPVAGEYEMYRTTNGGATWTVVPGTNIPNPLSTTEYGLVDVYTKYGSHIWFGTNTNRIFHSSDDGLNWLAATIPGATQGIASIAFRDALHGIAYANAGTPTTPTFGYSTTNDGGLTWTALAPNVPNQGMNDVCAIPGTTVFASCGAGNGNTFLSYSTDDGLTWTDWGSIGIQYLKIDFVNSTTGWAGSFSDQMNLGVGGIYKYTGAGFPSGLKPISQTSSINPYPNPTNGLITFTMPLAKRGLTIEVIDVFGKIVYSEETDAQTINETKTLHLDFLVKGVYNLSLKTKDSNYLSKIVID